MLVGDVEFHHVGGAVVIGAVGKRVEEGAAHGHGVMVGGAGVPVGSPTVQAVRGGARVVPT